MVNVMGLLCACCIRYDIVLPRGFGFYFWFGGLLTPGYMYTIVEQALGGFRILKSYGFEVWFRQRRYTRSGLKVEENSSFI